MRVELVITTFASWDGQVLTNTIVSTFIDFNRRVLFQKMDCVVGFSSL